MTTLMLEAHIALGIGVVTNIVTTIVGLRSLRHKLNNHIKDKKGIQ